MNLREVLNDKNLLTPFILIKRSKENDAGRIKYIELSQHQLQGIIQGWGQSDLKSNPNFLNVQDKIMIHCEMQIKQFDLILFNNSKYRVINIPEKFFLTYNIYKALCVFEGASGAGISD